MTVTLPAVNAENLAQRISPQAPACAGSGLVPAQGRFHRDGYGRKEAKGDPHDVMVIRGYRRG
jgi:hypothetical protein